MRKWLMILTISSLMLMASTSHFANTPRTYGPTTKTDQLWRIAEKVRPAPELSKQQTMMAILIANPSAFKNGNVNGLRSGYTLQIPSVAVIKSTPAISSLVQIAAQNAAWSNHGDVISSTARNGSNTVPKNTRKTKASTASFLFQPLASPVINTAVIETLPLLPPALTDKAESTSSPPLLSAIALPLHTPPAQASVLAHTQPVEFAATRGPGFVGDLLAQLDPANASNTFPYLTQQEDTHPSVLHPEIAHNVPQTPFITVATAETLIKNSIAAQLAKLSQKIDYFANKFNALEQYSTQRLDVIEDEHVAMKNQIASLDKQMKQLAENYLQYSTPVFHRSAFAEYGIWIMGSSILACLLVLIMTLSRRRPQSFSTARIDPAVPAKAAPSNDIDAIEDEYDYLGSQEGVAAKLDLARAYIDMGDTTQAINVLNEVISNGDQDQRSKARQILSDINLDTVH